MSFNDAFTVFPRLETKRLILRKFITEIDSQKHLELFRDPQVYEFFDWYPKNILESKNAIEKSIKAYSEKKEIRWCIALKENESETIGNCVLASFVKESRSEVGYMIGEEYWQKGIMTEALKEILYFGFYAMNLHRIHAIILAGNEASVNLLNKLNFTKEGDLRKYSYIPITNSFQDSMIYSLLKEECRNG